MQVVGKRHKFDFDDACKFAFDEKKARFVIAFVMATPDWNKNFEIMCDASDFSMGVILGHRIERTFKAIYYASKTFNEVQENYSQIRRC